jgi:hypothetical protein
MPPAEIETFFVGVDASPGFTPAVVMVALAAAGHRILSGSTLLDCRLQSSEELEQHRPPRGLARDASGVHRGRHRTLDLVVVKLARGVPVCHPRALHGMRFGRLAIIERIQQTLVIFVEQSVPDRIFHAVAVGLGRFVGIFRWLVDAGVRDKIEQALPFALIQIILVPGRAIADRRDFMRAGFSGLRVASFSGKVQSQWQSAHQNGAKRRIESRPHFVVLPRCACIPKVLSVSMESKPGSSFLI